jgi:hypothetical protein
MAHTWKYAIGLGLLGSALATGCVVKSGDGDISDAGEAGSGGTTGGSGGTTGGSSGKGGTGGGAGKGGSGGTTGGSAGKGGAAGSGGTTGGSAGVGGTTGGSAGMSGSGGTLPTMEETVPQCDPASGDLDNTPYPNCAPSSPADPDPCEACIEENCCEESIACYSFAPGNVCGWGGPEDGDFAGAGEIGCYVACLAEYVNENEVCDDEGRSACIGACQTTECGDVLGNQTSDLSGCIHDSCNDECLGISTCD